MNGARVNLPTKTGQMLSELYAKGTLAPPPARPPTRRPRSRHGPVAEVSWSLRCRLAPPLTGEQCVAVEPPDSGPELQALLGEMDCSEAVASKVRATCTELGRAQRRIELEALLSKAKREVAARPSVGSFKIGRSSVYRAIRLRKFERQPTTYRSA